MKVHPVKRGKAENCANCEQMEKGEYEGTCLVCGAVWDHDPSKYPTFVSLHRDQVNFGVFGL